MRSITLWWWLFSLSCQVGKSHFTILETEQIIPFPLRAASEEDSHSLQQENERILLRNSIVGRTLQDSDFAEFNELFENAIIRMDDEIEIQEKVLFDLSLRLRNIRCFELSVHDITVQHTRHDSKSIAVNVAVEQLDLRCDIDYRYDYGPFHGDGVARVKTNDNAASMDLEFTSVNFDTEPPNGSTPGECIVSIDIVDLNFDGDLMSEIFEIAERRVSNFIEGKVEALACDELASLGTTFIGDMMNLAEDFIEEYLTMDLGNEYTDPLFHEKTLQRSNTGDDDDKIVLLDFQDTENTIGSWFTKTLEELDAMLGTQVVENEGTEAEKTDLGVNVFLRTYFLEKEDASFTLEGDDIPFDRIIFQGHDRIIETTMTLDRLKIFGLDSFTRFEPLIGIGNYTLQNELSWDSLTIQLTITSEMKPSTKEDAILQDPTSQGIVEQFQVEFGVDSVDVFASFLLAIDQPALGSLALGPLLNTTSILPCFLSSIHAVELSGLDVTVSNIREPILSNFVSPGIDRVFSKSVEAAFAMYEGTLLQALPIMFQTTMRTFINDNIIAAHLEEPGNVACPTVRDIDGFIDFRDFFLPPDLAIVSGGSGLAPYGDVAYTMIELVRDQLLAADGDGFLSVNDFLIRPMTKSQSGEKGTLRFPSTVASYQKQDISNSLVRSFMDNFEISLSDTRIHNLDTFKQPAAILQPKFTPYKLDNILTMGPVPDERLNLTMNFLVAIEGEESPLEMRHNMDVSVSVSSTSLNTVFFATIFAPKLMNFPLRDVLDYNCWLATIPAPVLDGNTVSELSLGISEFAFSMSEMDINVNFLSSSTPAIAVLPEIFDSLKKVGALMKLNHRIVGFLQHSISGTWLQTEIARRLTDAAARCRHSDMYGTNVTKLDDTSENFPNLSVNEVDTLMFAIALAAQSTLVILTESHRLGFPEETNPISRQQSMNVFKSVVDWTDLNGKIGSMVNLLLKAAQDYLGSTHEDKKTGSDDLGINILMRDFWLGQDGDLIVNFDDLSFDLPGNDISLATLRVQGLDSLSNFTIWEPVAPQTLENNMTWNEVTMDITLVARNSSTNEIAKEVTISFGVRNFQASLALAVALDEDKLGALEIGNFLHTKDIIPCLLTAIDLLEITQFYVSVDSFIDPTVDGLLPDSGEIVSLFTQEIFGTLRSRIISAFPELFNKTVRKILNSMITSYRENAKCQSSGDREDSSFIDFRMFFDSTSNSYGDLPPLLKKLVDNELLSADATSGLPRINDVVIAPFTKKQSGTRGALEFPGNVFGAFSKSLPQFGFTTLDFRAFNPEIDNLDTVGAPIEILKPKNDSGVALDNFGIIGTTYEPLRLGMNAILAATGDPLLSMQNEMHLSVEMSEADLFATLLAKVVSNKLFSFPLRDLAISECWLAIFAIPELDQDGLRVSTFEPSLALDYIGLALSSMRFNFSCVNCTSPGLSVLPEVLQSLETVGVSDVLEGYLINFAMDLLQSEYMQTMVDRLIFEGSRRCPHSMDFVNQSESSTFISPQFPLLSRESIETIAFAATFGLSVGVVAVAESHLPIHVEDADPLAGQHLLEEDTLNRYLDFTSLDSSIGEWADLAIEKAREYLRSIVDDSEGPGGRDLRINALLRSFLLDDQKAFILDFNDLNVGSQDVMVSLLKVRVMGLDTISTFNVIDAIGPQTLLNEIRWRNLGVELIVSMTTMENNSPTKQDISISLEVDDVEISLAVLLAFDLDLLGSLELGSILHIESILPCLLSTARAANLTQFEVSVGAITYFSVNGFLSKDINNAVSQMASTILQEYGNVILSALPGIFDTTVRSLLNNWIQFYAQSNVGCRSALYEMISQTFVDLRDLLLPKEASLALGGSGSGKYGDIFSTALNIIQDLVIQVDPETGMSAMNDVLIGPLTRSQSNVTGSLIYPGDLFDQGAKISVGGLNAQVQLKASDARIDNLNSVGSPLEFMKMVMNESYQINNTATFGVSESPLGFSVRLFMSLLDDNGKEIQNDIEIGLGLHKANLILRALLKISESRFLSFPLRDVLNLDCWLATIPAPELDPRGVRMEGISRSAGLEEFAASVAELNLNLACVDCSSPRMSEMTDLLASTEAKKDATDIANMMLDYVSDLMGGTYLQVQIDRLLNDAEKRCPHSPLYETKPKAIEYEPFDSGRPDGSMGLLVALGLVCVTLVIAISVLVTVIRCVVRRRHRRFLRTLSPQQTRHLVRRQAKEENIEADLNQHATSMFRSPAIPIYVRWTMPLIILGNIAFFLSGHLSLGATVNIEAELAGEKFKVEQFFEFSMAQSTIDIWNAGGKELAILILIFSGIWPYTKQLITLLLWFLPPRTLSLARRGSFLLWLDVLGKWSMVDIFVLVISIAAFRVSVLSPNLDFLPKDFYSVNLLVVPLWGLYANMIAQLISQVSSHVIIHYHRQSIQRANEERLQLVESASTGGGERDSSRTAGSLAETELSGSAGTDRDELCKHEFGRPHRADSEKLVIRKGIDKATCAVAVCLILFVALGCSLSSFSLEILGIIGIAVESGQGFEDAKTQHSIFTVIKLLFEEAGFLNTAGDYIGLGTLSILLLFSVLLAPMILCTSLLWQWFRPLTRPQRTRLAILVEMLQAWQYSEVYLIAVFVASWQLGPISEFMINSYCIGLEDTFAQLVYYGILKPEDAQCFRVQSSIESGSFVLASGAILLALLSSFVTKAVTQYFRDKDEAEQNLQESNEEASLKSDFTYDDVDDEASSSPSRRIRPVPTLFSDTYRWTLYQREKQRRSQQALFPETPRTLDSLVDDSEISSGFGRDVERSCVHHLPHDGSGGYMNGTDITEQFAISSELHGLYNGKWEDNQREKWCSRDIQMSENVEPDKPFGTFTPNSASSNQHNDLYNNEWENNQIEKWCSQNIQMSEHVEPATQSATTSHVSSGFNQLHDIDKDESEDNRRHNLMSENMDPDVRFGTVSSDNEYITRSKTAEDARVASSGQNSTRRLPNMVFKGDQDLVVDHDLFVQENETSDFDILQDIKDNEGLLWETTAEASRSDGKEDVNTSEVAEDEPFILEESLTDSGDYYFDDDEERSNGSWTETNMASI